MTPEASINLAQRADSAEERLELAVTATSAAWRARLESDRLIGKSRERLARTEGYAEGLEDGRPGFFASAEFWGPTLFVVGVAFGIVVGMKARGAE